MARYGKKATQKVKRAMHERKKGTLKSGRSGKTVAQPKAIVGVAAALADMIRRQWYNSISFCTHGLLKVVRGGKLP